jgi:2-methylcitrate dehydratase
MTRLRRRFASASARQAREDTTPLAGRLASEVLGLGFSDLPRAVVREAKRRVIDAVGCALGAVGCPPGLSALEVIKKIGRNRGPSASLRTGAALIAGGFETSPELAAFYNGILVRYLDYNDTYLSKEPCHPSDNLSAALAVAQACERDGREFLTAFVAGYEVIGRLCDAASLRRGGWDHVTYGAISSSLLAARLMRLTAAQAAHALSLSLVPHIALRQTRAGELSQWKACAFANAARNGVFASSLAACGMTGPAEVFEGRFGFFTQVSGRFAWRSRSGGRSDWKILQSSIKFFPAEYHAQSAIEAALKMRGRLPCPPSSIEEVVVETFEAAASIIGSEKEKWRPIARETADHSLPYLVSVALMDGTVGPRQFTPQRIHEAGVRRLLSRVRVRERRDFSALYPRAVPNRVTLRIGKRRWSEEVLYPRGHWRNPMTDLEVERKFLRQAGKVLKPARAEEILDRLWLLEKAGSLKALMALLVVKH